MSDSEMNIRAHQYAHELERYLEILGFTEFSADYFRRTPTEAMVSVLNWMCNNNYFSEEELSGYQEEYSLSRDNLSVLLSEELIEEKIGEFIAFVKYYLNRTGGCHR